MKGCYVLDSGVVHGAECPQRLVFDVVRGWITADEWWEEYLPECTVTIILPVALALP